MRRLGFTMIELIFVIIIMGIIGKFGVEFLAQSYKGFIFSNVNHNLQSQSKMAVESIASRLQYRIKDSTIKRQSDVFANYEGIGSTVILGTEKDYNILEWVGADIDSFRGNSSPYWSGIIDLYHTNSNNMNLFSPETNATSINLMIQALSNGARDINDSALYFIGADSDIKTGYGWDSNLATQVNVLDTQTGSMHHVTAPSINSFAPIIGNFTGIDVYEYYQLAWTAYAVGISDWNATDNNTGTLMLYYDYQPWSLHRYDDNGTNNPNAIGHITKKAIIMENVSTFQFKSVGSVIKIQVCVNSKLVEDYSLCKEKTIF
ncbi:MAG: prepilin-type N-terminal cleavage/methylation domain-containing protein [Sulfurimonas sp.]|jgi:prepilin-type N-terminal cleavage/methylation domain-containing protein|uniref:prepilin-type N-terminal cleavage/methylation domain-containing protein n=1 Tax=Sulfurimonas sp. TaxID=2022749 RepID=UPI0039E49C13